MRASLAVTGVLVIGAAVGVPAAAYAATTQPAAATAPAASLKLKADTALPGQAVKFTGSGFKAGEAVTLYWKKAGGTKLVKVTASKSGAIAGSFKVPLPKAGSAKLNVVAVGAASKKAATFLFVEECTDEWVNTKGGNWATAKDWSAGAVPGPSAAACITLPSSKKYTVVYNQLTGTTTVGSLRVGAPSGKGTQTLAVDGTGADSNITLNHASEILARGVLTLNSGGSSNVFLGGAGTLDNFGTIETLPGKGWSRYLDGNYVNEPGGTFKIAAGTLPGGATYLRGPATFDEKGGTVEVAKGSEFNPQSATVTQSGGKFENSGLVRLDGGTLVKTGGTATGNAWQLWNAVTLKDKAGTGAYTYLDSGFISGLVAAGQTVTVDGADAGGNGVQLQLQGNVTNDGKIVMTASTAYSATGGGPTNAWLSDASGNHTLFNYGTLLTEPGPGWSRYFSTQFVNEKTGTVTLDGTSNIVGGGDTFTNYGKLNLGPAAWFYFDGTSYGKANLVDAASSTTNVTVGTAAEASHIFQYLCSAGGCTGQVLTVGGKLTVTKDGAVAGSYVSISSDNTAVAGAFAAPAGYGVAYNAGGTDPFPNDGNPMIGDVVVSAG